ncbi:MAG TPA: 3-keto-5-aminohexanoate cleavage protein [Clostridiales bacterium UBA8153]|nr:3-keto-5-aminohexanoate cleavage protein [Clostridiales bacterium UBA8153]
MEPLIITVAPVGAEATRAQHPALPLTPAEIALAVYEAYREGASIAHLHARDVNGDATQDARVYAEIIGEVTARCDIIIQVSTGGAVGMTRQERAGPLALRPEMATLTTGTVNFGDGVFYNAGQDIQFFATEMGRLGIKPEIEIFEVGMIDNAMRLVRDGLLSRPLHFDFVMGVPGGIGGSPAHLLHLIHSLPPQSSWTVAGIGRHELPLGAMAVILGGHVRVGFEDNLYYSRGVLAASNAQLVARIVRIARELGRPVAGPAQARAILGLKNPQQEKP